MKDRMKVRTKQLLSLLSQQQDWLKGMTLATLLGVSDRTVRSDIEALNAQYPNTILASKRQGYRLAKNLPSELVEVLEQALPQTPNERRNYLLKLLLREELLDCEQLVLQLYISESTLKQDMTQVKTIIQAYPELQLQQSGKTWQLVGTEFYKRKLYRELLSSEIHEEFVSLTQVTKMYPDMDFPAIIACVEQVMGQQNYTIRPTAFPLLMLHIGIMLQRWDGGQFMKEMVEAPKTPLTIQQLATDIVQLLAAKRQVKVPVSESQALARLLTSYKENSELKATAILHGRTIVIQEVMQVLGQELERLSGIDFLVNEEFVYRLHLHLQSLIERLTYQQALPNLLLYELKRQYPFVFDMAVSVSKKLATLLACELSEDEVGLIGVHLGAAYSQMTVKPLLQVAVIATDNRSLVQSGLKRLQQRFGQRITVVKQMPLYDADQIAELDIELIISFMPMAQKVRLPFVVVSPFFNNEDEMMVMQCLNQLEKRQLDLKVALQMGDYLDEALFQAQTHATTPQTVMTQMAQNLATSGYVTTEFLPSVLQREALSSTDFDYGIAIPHPLLPCSYQSKLAITVLQEPLLWGKYPVKLVVMLAIAEHDQKFSRLFFNWLGECLARPQKMAQLFSAKSRDEFIAAILSE